MIFRLVAGAPATVGGMRRIAVGVAVVGLFSLLGCGGGIPAAQTSTSAAPAAPAVEPATPSEAAPGMTLDPEDAAAAEVVAFGRPQSTGKGTVVTVAAPVGFTTSATAAPKGGAKAARFKITVTAPKDQVIDPTTATFTASRAGAPAEQVVDLDEDSGLDDVWSLPRLRPGKTVSFSIGFVGDASGQWDLDLGATDRTLMWSSDGAK